MNIVITGHTSGLGKIIFDHLSKNHSVVGLSRSNGYDIEKDCDKIIDVVSKSDLFINCANNKHFQKQLLLSAVNKVDNIIVIGTAMQMFDEFLCFNYLQEKRSLADCCRHLSLDPNISTNILLINISFLPRTKNSLVQTDNFIEYSQVENLIDYWIQNKTISEVSFSWKMTDLVASEFAKLAPNIDFKKFKGYKND